MSRAATAKKDHNDEDNESFKPFPHRDTSFQFFTFDVYCTVIKEKKRVRTGNSLIFLNARGRVRELQRLLSKHWYKGGHRHRCAQPSALPTIDQPRITINKVATIGWAISSRAWLQRSRFSGVRSFIHWIEALVCQGR